MLVVALCKTALLLSTLEACTGGLETSGGPSECQTLNLANPAHVEGMRHRIAGKRTAARLLPKKLHKKLLPPARGMRVPPPDGHRLSNGLRAPLQC